MTLKSYVENRIGLASFVNALKIGLFSTNIHFLSYFYHSHSHTSKDEHQFVHSKTFIRIIICPLICFIALPLSKAIIHSDV